MLLMAGREVAVSKENKSHHFMGSAMGRVLVAGAYGAGAVPGGCINPAVVRGLEVACVHLGFGYCLGCR